MRGLHFQDDYPEIKLVRCVAGEIKDVAVDLRPGSRTYRCAESFLLSGSNACSLYIPAGFAHGFMTLTADCVVHYQMSEFYHPHDARGIRWDDPALAIQWPNQHPWISDRDANLPYLAQLK